MPNPIKQPRSTLLARRRFSPSPLSNPNMRGGGRGDHTSQILDDLCALISTVLRSPLPLAAAAPPQLRRRPKLSPAGVAALLLGVSFALMLCGSVTFVIGFIMMPWVLGLVMLFYFVGVLSSISWIGRAVLCPSVSPSSSSKEIAEKLQWNFSYEQSR